ncbi:hypothetical protein ERJ75_000902000 [Trypanosoma vivax]|nr:hypothetical protein ERJ75_000902000 [Trypanosoma vivax]
MQRLFCTCAFLLAAASVAALGADPGSGSNAAEFAVRCGAYREAKAVKDSAEQMRDGIESFVAVGREGHVVEETGGPGSGDGIGTQPSVGSARTRTQGGCRRSSQDGRELRDAGDLRQQAGGPVSKCRTQKTRQTAAHDAARLDDHKRRI